MLSDSKGNFDYKVHGAGWRHVRSLLEVAQEAAQEAAAAVLRG
jgi:hypothetical protein